MSSGLTCPSKDTTRRYHQVSRGDILNNSLVLLNTTTHDDDDDQNYNVFE